ncbi:MAG TPA: FAD-dependent oxidoreductase, partial [Vicinamibacterales bacterium]
MDLISAEPARIALGVSGFTFADLYEPARLKDLYERFSEEVSAVDPSFWHEWDAYRQAPDAPRSPIDVSSLIVRMAPHVSRFLVRLFGDDEAAARLREETEALNALFHFKIDFVRRRALPLLKGPAQRPAAPTGASSPVVATPEDEAIVATLIAGADAADRELAIARAGSALLEREAALKTAPEADRAAVARDIDALKRWCAAHLNDPVCRTWVVFHFPETLHYEHLVEVEHPSPDLPELMTGPEARLRRREGFTLTDERANTRQILSEVHYCVLCHERDKDSCSKGIRAKDGTFSANPLGIQLPGCPLDEKISEMHALRKDGDPIGALALIMIDNPMCPGTGHRICNDCMKACIYQKQDPVNIPQTETGALTTTLRMPWGVEMYGLLTRWNPLNVRRPYALPYNGRNVLVVGLGPAGYTLSHYLLNEGFGVVGIDGLKIEPFSDALTGTDEVPPRPIRDWDEIYKPLDTRVLEGFGGVSEYGITVRWDKNFLTLLHLTLARRRTMRIFGGVRFGGAITMDDAWQYGFDHIAIAAGAGRPTIIDIKNNLIRGIRKASDFLMALQLSGAFKHNSLPNLQARLPAVVIGGGLTAIDTATELMAYYPVQVEKVLDRYETLSAERGEAQVRAGYDEQELWELDEFLSHGRAVRAERSRAAGEGEKPDLIRLVREWGGVSIAYRKRMMDSPAYRLNHEEIIKALEEGIGFAENLDPVEAVPDEQGQVTAMKFRRQRLVDGKWVESDDIVELPARTVLVAAGTSPNVTYEKEYEGSFALDNRQKFFAQFSAVEQADGRFALEPDRNGFFTSYSQDGHFVTYYGDNHPRYAGNVVKAMASAKHGYPHVVKLFAHELAALDPTQQPERDRAWRRFTERLAEEFTATVVRVDRLTETIVEVVVHAPAAAQHFHPGQFYRLQNLEAEARRAADGTPLMMEGIALTGAWVDKERGLLSLIALELGVSSRLCMYLRPGEPVVVMGPTGTPTEIPRGQNVLLAGGGLGNAVLFSIAKALREHGNKVIYFAGYKKGEDLFKREEIEAATDQVIWSTDMGAAIAPERPQDAHFRGNIVQAMIAYDAGELGETLVPLHTVDRIIAIGSDRMMAAVKAAR